MAYFVSQVPPDRVGDLAKLLVDNGFPFGVCKEFADFDKLAFGSRSGDTPPIRSLAVVENKIVSIPEASGTNQPEAADADEIQILSVINAQNRPQQAVIHAQELREASVLNAVETGVEAAAIAPMETNGSGADKKNGFPEEERPRNLGEIVKAETGDEAEPLYDRDTKNPLLVIATAPQEHMEIGNQGSVGAEDPDDDITAGNDENDVQNTPSGTNKFACLIPTCGAVFPAWPALLGHFDEKHPQAMWCDECQKQFIHPGYFIRHQEVAHQEKSRKEVQKRKKKGSKEKKTEPVCKDCGRRFQRMGNLYKHTRVFQGKPHGYCEPCEKTYAKEAYEKHLIARH